MASWIPWASLAMAVVAFSILKLADRWLEVRATPRNMADWLPVLEPVVLRIVHRCRETAEAVAEWNEIKAKVPPEYHRIVDSVIRYAQLAEEQMHEELAASRTAPLRSMFSDLPGHSDGATMVPATIPPPGPEPEYEYETNVVQFPSDREWVAGQLLKRTAT